ncbi:MAG: hypothetical protein ACD_81C00058G0001 [uncultured bacterium]|nr:MAG: hypothetical protein ACD_81C00058G0001 [uncultured bacterium]
MLQCAWCKKENISPSEWSKNREPLCERCAHKYRFGFKCGAITEKVANLSEEQKHNIGKEMHNTGGFWEAMLLVDKEVLTGRAKKISRAVIACLVVGFFVLGVFFIEPMRGTFWEMLFMVAYLFSAYLFHERISWHLKQWQLKKKARAAGYRGI